MKKMMILAVLCLAAASSYADVTLDTLFTDHMVLQRKIPVTVFGQASPDEKVTVSFAGQSRSTTADNMGQWSVKLAAMKASAKAKPLTVKGKNTITLKDILVGDIWVCSGQSNMDWTLGRCRRPKDIESANFPLIRQFNVKRRVSAAPFPQAQGQWVVCTPKTAGSFTAVGFYFGRKLHKDTGVPIGLIKSAWGGTKVEPWIAPGSLAAVPALAKSKADLAKKIAAYEKKSGNPQTKIDAYLAAVNKAFREKTALPKPLMLKGYPISSQHPHNWFCLYNGMIHPLIRFRIKGAIWYQGESNGGEGDSYFQKKRALIEGWRKVWGQGDFPFYFVQLANFQNPKDNPAGGDGWAKLRMAQCKTLTIPQTGMAVAIDLADVGNPRDIHPKNKLDVGERLALWSLAKDYGKKKLVYSGPLYKSMKVDCNRIILTFDHVGSGLTVATKKGYDPIVKEPTGKLRHFAIAGEDQEWVWADAVIDGKTVVVSSPKIAKPVAVRYAYTMNPEGCNLYNKEGLPASPFRTDDW